MFNTLKKINFLVSKRQRKGLIILTMLLFLGMIFEILGLGILIPTLNIILDPETLNKTPILFTLKRSFPEFSHNDFIYFFLGIIFLIYLTKTMLLVFITYKQNIFLNNVIAYISNNLFNSYLSRPYIFYINRNSSDLIKNIQIEIQYFYTFLFSLISLFLEAGFLLSIIATLIYIEPLGAISVGIFYGTLSMIFLQFSKKKLSRWGELRAKIDSLLSKNVFEGLGAIKDLMILGKRSFYINQFKNNNNLRARLNANLGTISQIPRFFLELISILGLISFVTIMLLKGIEVKSLITILGIFVAATFRMIPSFNKIIAAFQTLKYHMPSVNIIYKELNGFIENKEKTENHNNLSFQSKIELIKINFGFNLKNKILKDVNLQIQKGQTIGIIGESGSGKSTIVDLLMGFHKPTSGQILIDGVDGFQMNQSWKNSIGYVSQSIYLIDASIKNNIALGIPENEINELKIKELLLQVQLESFMDTLEKGVNTEVGERGIQLSGGQRQRIGLARALYHDPDILILDEATSALDTETEKEVMNSIYSLKGKKTIIIIAHRHSTLTMADCIYQIKDSKILKV